MWIIIGSILLWGFALFGLAAVIIITIVCIDEAADISASWSKHRRDSRFRKDMDPRHRKHWKHYLQGHTAGMTIASGGIDGHSVQKAEGRAVQNLSRAEFDAYAAGRQAGVEEVNKIATTRAARTDYLSGLDQAQERYKAAAKELTDGLNQQFDNLT